MVEPMSDADEASIAAQLGRPPRGVAGVAWRCPCGKPGVVATEPRLPDGTPFPTTYYLTCPRATSGCSTLEAQGMMAEMSARLEQDAELASAYLAAHEAYLADRARLGDVPEIRGISAGGMPTRVKCLHVLVGHALAAGPGVNPLGDEALAALGEFWSRPCLEGQGDLKGAEPSFTSVVGAQPRSGGARDDTGDLKGAEPSFTSNRVAVIDCGTNSIRLLVMSRDVDGRLVEHDRRLELVRLGQGVDATGEFHPDALARTFAACERFAVVIADQKCDRVRFVATSAARDARNREAFFGGVRERLGVEVEVIEGEEEARLSFHGALAGVAVSEEPVLVIDIGGGSTEHIVGSASGRIDHAISLDVGSVRIRERYLLSDPPTDAEITAARTFVGSLLDASGVDFASIRTFIGVAGTVTSLSAIHQELAVYDRAVVHGSVLTVGEVHALAVRLLASTAADVEATTCLPLKRAEVICAGALIADEIARRVDVPMIISESDILDGMAMELLAP